MTVLIPAYNPDEKLVRLVRELRTRFQDIVVVNDGSDGGTDVFSEIAPLVTKVLVHEVNRGKGAAIKTGLGFIGAEDTVIADADGQHTPDDIARIASALEGHRGGIVLGVRSFTGEVPFRSRFGNFWTCLYFRLAVGYRVSDTQTGLRGIPASLTERIRNLPGERYEYEMAMLVDAKDHPSRPLEVPIRTVYLDDNATSHFSPLRDSIRIYRTMFFWRRSNKRR